MIFFFSVISVVIFLNGGNMKRTTISHFSLLIAMAILLAFPGIASAGGKKEPPAPSYPPAPEWGPHLIPEMVLVPGGTFRMGSNDNMDIDAKPVHTVTLDGFYMSKNLITQEQYHAVVGFNPSLFQGGLDKPRQYAQSYNMRYELPEGVTSGDKLPVENLTWFDVLEFCNKLSALEGLTPVYEIANRKPAEGYPINNVDVTVDWSANGYRMPTEAEWEYAAKGGDGMGPYFIYAGSNDPEAVAWYANLAKTAEGLTTSASAYVPHPVGLKAPNALGIYDLSGNVYEWCWDWFGEYPAAAQTNPKGPPDGDNRVRRGGCPNRMGESIIRVAFRDSYSPIYINGQTGFRVVRNK